jgi:acyl-coenzyme A synthetase/AMP-(fatty) acid ligase
MMVQICPQEVEGALLEHEAVASAGVVGVKSDMHGENVRAYITLAGTSHRRRRRAALMCPKWIAQ